MGWAFAVGCVGERGRAVRVPPPPRRTGKHGGRRRGGLLHVTCEMRLEYTVYAVAVEVAAVTSKSMD